MFIFEASPPRKMKNEFSFFFFLEIHHEKDVEDFVRIVWGAKLMRIKCSVQK